jgi:hypothetical protein
LQILPVALRPFKRRVESHVLKRGVAVVLSNRELLAKRQSDDACEPEFLGLPNLPAETGAFALRSASALWRAWSPLSESSLRSTGRRLGDRWREPFPPAL